MPNQDGTGPNKKGPQTGRGLGPCNKTNSTPQPRGFGRNAGRGQGRGRRTGN